MNRLQKLADEMNARLAAADVDERWVLCTDETSNSVGTWFMGNIGGVMYANIMRTATYDVIANKYGLTVNAVRRFLRGFDAENKSPAGGAETNPAETA